MIREHLSHKAKSLNIPIAEDSQGALALIAGGLMYFLINHTKKTIFALLLVSGSMLYVIMDYYQSSKAEKVKIEEAQPVKASLFNFNGFPVEQAYAQTKSISIDGKNYGVIDDDFEVFKLYNQPCLIVHDKRTGIVLKLEVGSLSPDRIMQYRKSK